MSHARTTTSHRGPRRRGGFTLIEAVMASLVSGVLLTACVMTLRVASQSMVNATRTANASAVTARVAVDQMTSDLKLALSFSEQTANAVTFTVPDRTGDNVAETVRYAWDGVSGHPLTRQINGGSAVTVASDVRALNLAYITQTVGTLPPLESAEQLILAHDGGTGTNIKTFNPLTTAWAAETFNAGLPPNATSWKITRLKLQFAKRFTSSTGTFTVTIRAADAANKPTGAALATGSVNVAGLTTTAAWTDVTFATMPSGLSPTSNYCIVVSGSSSTNVGNLYYDNANTDPGTYSTNSTNSGSSWSAPTGSNSLQFYVYGTVTTPQ